MQNHEVKIFEKDDFILKAKTNDGESYLFDVESVAKSLGLTTVAKSGNECVRWKRVNEYLNKYLSQDVGRGSYIPEPMVYKLAFKANNEVADKFQDWLAVEVLPTLRKTGFYEMAKKNTPEKPRIESLASVNNAVKILTPMLQAAGCDGKIQLLTAKSLYEKAGVEIPLIIEADQHYFDTVHIARRAGLYYQNSGKPADKAVNEIIRRLDLPEHMYTETWESKGKWQGTVRKYIPEVISMVRAWYADKGYPRDIEYEQCDGQKKAYHVIWKDAGA